MSVGKLEGAIEAFKWIQTVHGWRDAPPVPPEVAAMEFTIDPDEIRALFGIEKGLRSE